MRLGELRIVSASRRYERIVGYLGTRPGQASQLYTYRTCSISFLRLDLRDFASENEMQGN